MQFPCKQSISVSPCYSKINRRCLDEWGKWSKMFLPVITAPIVLAHLIYFLNRRCHVNPKWSNIYPANMIRLAYSRYKHVRANILALTCYFCPILINSQCFTYSSRQCLFSKAVATRNGNNEFYKRIDTFKLQITIENARQKLNYCLLPDPLFFRYYQPLNWKYNEISLQCSLQESFPFGEKTKID